MLEEIRDHDDHIINLNLFENEYVDHDEFYEAYTLPSTKKKQVHSKGSFNYLVLGILAQGPS